MQQHTSLESHYINYNKRWMQDELNFNLPRVLVPIFCAIGWRRRFRRDIIHNESSLWRVLDSMHDININLKFRNDDILVIINYLFHISFTLENDNTILWEIYSTYTLSVRQRLIHTKILRKFMISHCIFSVSFRFPFRYVFRSPF